MFTVPILIWLSIGLICFGIWFGYHEYEFRDITFKMFMGFIIFLMLGPINVLFAIARFFGMMISS